MNDVPDLETLREWGRRYSNWGRWGPADELGTLNYITPARVVAAASLVRSGQVISCAWPFDAAETNVGAAHLPVRDAHTLHQAPAPAPGSAWWDAHGRVSYDGVAYNDRALADLAPHGARSASIDRFCDGVVGRGVLLDLPGRLGVPWLDDATRILPSDLDACAEASGVAIETGDILLVRTGRMTRAFTEGSWNGYAGGPTPGLSLRCARWLHERQVAAVATDTWCVEVVPHEIEGLAMPLHQIAVRDIGLLLGESFHLDRLAEACTQDGRYAFFFSAPPQPGTGALGSIVNPVAVK
jgi:kynurenine formamidase